VYDIDSLVSLGKFQGQLYQVEIETMPKKIKHVDGMNTRQGGQIVLIQLYDGGTTCDETGMPRHATAKLRCCTPEQHNFILDYQRATGVEAKALLFKVVEDTQKICSYTAEVCTPLLCGDEFKATSELRVGNKKEGATQSVRATLERKLGHICLQRNDGWWRYELCHMRHARQFHASTAVDAATGLATVVIESDHKLGLFDMSNLLSPYPDDHEVMHMENERTANAVFVMDYINGDMCDNSDDVKDESLKKVARATTVKFSCGKNYELVRIEEDRTCHYVFHVTVPELCRNPLFRAPVLKEQVVKCLPVASDLL